MRATRSFFERVPPDAAEAALATLDRRRFAVGTVIVAEGDYLEEMYVLREGTRTWSSSTARVPSTS